MNAVMTQIRGLLDLGGPVVLILLVLSILAAAVALYKLWQFSASGVGSHRRLRQGLDAWDTGNSAGARAAIAKSRSHLAPLVSAAMDHPGDAALRQRLEAEAAMSFGRLEGGFRVLDNIAQMAPLLGLFGTVLGMINAFRALQAAGDAVDPTVLAGGIWVALLTTAAGLAVAMPTSLILAWFESRMARERDFADLLLAQAERPIRPDRGMPVGAAAHA